MEAAHLLVEDEHTAHRVRRQAWYTAGILLLVLSYCPVPALAEQSEAIAGSTVIRSVIRTSQQTAHPRLFGTVEFRLPLKKQKNWLEMLRRHDDASVFRDEKRLNRSTTWKELKSKAKSKTLPEMLEEVNRFWNGWPYRADEEAWGVKDYWATPAEFLSRSGDCEDYCIVKYFTLRKLGVPAEDMRIVIVRETIRGLAHAILAVYDGQEVHILDNLSDQVRPMRRVRNYQPHFSVNEKGRWMHVKATPVKKNGKPMENRHDTKR